MTALINELCPDYVGQKKISLSLGVNTLRPVPFSAVDVDVDYTAALPADIILPLELTILAPSASNFYRKIYNKARPNTITFQPRQSGSHIVRLAEVGHNRWFGYLQVIVAGDSSDGETVT